MRILLQRLAMLGSLLVAAAAAGCDGSGGSVGGWHGDSGPGPDVSSGFDLDRCVEALVPREGDASDSYFQVLTLASEDDALRLRLAMEVPPSDFPVGGPLETYILVRFGVVRDGTPLCIADPASFEYYSTHHNFNDTAYAMVAGERYEVSMNLRFSRETGEYVATWEDTLRVLAPDGAVREGPIALRTEDCHTVPAGRSYPCGYRPRSDL